MDYFFDFKVEDISNYDLIIELQAINQWNQLECTLVIYCKIVRDSNKQPGANLEHKIKVESQRIKIGNQWYTIQGIFGLRSKEGA